MENTATSTEIQSIDGHSGNGSKEPKLRVRDVMKPVPVLPRDAAVSEAARVMNEEDVSMVPVGTEDDIAGVVTPNDIVAATADPGSDAAAMKLDEILQNLMCFCHEGEQLCAALKAMLSTKSSRLLVRDAAGGVVGVIAMEDILHADPDLRDQVAV
ncbi:MAG: hypothetical protein QOD99_1067 [Chthoniobacter sp.]|jgi:predicted transcriptional regulator|nr:hypothetical protein [Chthoniobacter sp.]